jgi:stearoyl-CoA desaturase (delta-9 desaturase)
VPVAGFLLAVVLLWGSFVGVRDLVILAALYAVTGLGVTVGFHRLLTHRAFRTYRPIEYAFAIAGTMSVQGSVIDWVADHRMHHAHADEAGDPHSPHGFGHGPLAGLRGLWHGHVGWLFTRGHQADHSRYVRDLLEDRGMRAIGRGFPLIVLAGLALPAAAGYALGGTAEAALTGLLWGGLVRVFLLHHVTFAINSVCHFFGTRRYETPDESTNVFWLAPLSFGEAWHNNHHAFPRSAFHGQRWWELDPGGLALRAMRRLGLAWDLVEISPERQRSAEHGVGLAALSRTRPSS